ncbi:MAG: 30S ribosomal protein S3 [Candidatus Aenigmarchaeota archaeon]|nr:30S ribosomal protein S3 [Candidatus Aenigmarchaeota archaeon]
MLKKYFVKQGIREVSIQDFIRDNFPSADYSNIELQRTPLGLKVLIYTHKPGRVIGRSGSKINKMSEMLKTKFELDNPQLDVKSIANPNLDAKIVAKQIKTALERGYNYKKIGNLSMKRVMDAGAIGVQIVISGKLGGSKGRIGKFTAGYLKHCGDTAVKLVDYGFEEATTRPGKIGIKVRIMREFMDITGEIIKKGREEKKEAAAEETKRDAVLEEGSLDFDYQEIEEDEDVVEEPVGKEEKKSLKKPVIEEEEPDSEAIDEGKPAAKKSKKGKQ